MRAAAGTPLHQTIAATAIAAAARALCLRRFARWPAPAPAGPGAAAALLAGAGACLALPALAPWPLSMLLLVLGALAWHQSDARRWLGAALVGFACAGLHATHALSLQLPQAWERTDAWVTGVIADLPVHEPRRTRMLFEVEQARAADAGLADKGLADKGPADALAGQRLRLAWYTERGGARPSLRAGQRWTLPVRLRAPRGLRNPGGPDAEKHALAQRLAGTGYVHEPAFARRLTGARGLEAWRESMSDRIAAAVPSPSSRFVRALALGDTRGLDDADWNALRANGLTHLIAISGFHVGLVAGFFALLLRGTWWLLPALGRRWPAPVAAALGGLCGAVVYAAVAGFAVPTLRTALMIAVVAFARVLRRPFRIADALALAAIALVLADPLSLLSAGFWLSFAGVAWLVWCLPNGATHPLRDFLAAQGVATLGLLPLGALLFGQASLAGPLANLVAVPWWSLVVVPLALFGLGLEALHAGAGEWAWRAAAWAFDLAWPGFEWLAAGRLALWWLPEARWFAYPLALLGAFWLLLPRGVPGKPLALLLWLPLLWPERRLPEYGDAVIDVIDVGQGLSVLVRTSRHALLYDMGPAIEDGFDAGERAVVPALHALGVRRLDRAVVSHGDNDHAGGWDSVRLAFPLPRPQAPPGAPIAGAVPCLAGQRWNWDGVEFAYLHPGEHFPYLRNESSCVLRVASRHGVALLTGDIGEIIEARLAREAPALLRAAVVLAPHHGSGGSSSPAFIAATGARHVLVSSGHGNRFGHPRAEAVARWRGAGARVHVTAEHGALQVRLQAGGAAVESRRAARPRLWDAAAR